MPSYQIGKGQEVIFRDFAPDLDPTTPGIILDASNAMPTMKGYAARNTPVNVFINSLTALPVTPSGAYIALFSTGAVAIYAAGQGHIYQLQPGPGWVEVEYFDADLGTKILCWVPEAELRPARIN